MRALAIGDSHLGAGIDLGRLPGDRLREQEEVWAEALQYAREYACDVVLHGGDLFDARRPTPEHVLAAVRPLNEHREAGGCPVVMALGNHERSGISEATMPAALASLGAFHVSQVPEVVGTFGGVTVCTLPWAPVSRIVAAEGGGDRDDVNAYAAELLVKTARGLREQVSGPCVLLCHWSISGSALPSGLPVDQIREPILEIAELDAIGFDAIAASHIHEAQIIGRDGRTPAFYTGSPMPLNFGEADSEHGVWILETDPAIDAGAGSPVLVPRFVPIESRPLVKIAAQASDVAGRVGLGFNADMIRDAVVKLTIQATQEDARRLDIAAIKTALISEGAYKVASVQLDVERPERARVEGLDDSLDELAALELWLDAQGVNGDRAATLRERTERYLGAVRA